MYSIHTHSNHISERINCSLASAINTCYIYMKHIVCFPATQCDTVIISLFNIGKQEGCNDPLCHTVSFVACWKAYILSESACQLRKSIIKMSPDNGKRMCVRRGGSEILIYLQPTLIAEKNTFQEKLLFSKFRRHYRAEETVLWNMKTRRSYYYDINKKYLMLVGQWPYQKPKEKLIYFTLIIILAISSIIPQVTLIIVKNFF